MKYNNQSNTYAIILDKHAGLYYPAKVKDIILIDAFDDCLIRTELNDVVVVPMRNLYETYYDMITALNIANKD